MSRFLDKHEYEAYTEILFSLRRIREHIADKAKLPILIFPEGREQLYWFYCSSHFLPLSAVDYTQSLQVRYLLLVCRIN